MTYEKLVEFVNLQDIKNIIGNKEIKIKSICYTKYKDLGFGYILVDINITNGIIKENNKKVNRYLNEMDLKVIKKQINIITKKG